MHALKRCAYDGNLGACGGEGRLLPRQRRKVFTLDVRQIDTLALDLFLRGGHGGAALLKLFHGNLAFTGERDQAAELYLGIERAALGGVKTIFGFPAFKGEAFDLEGISFGRPCRGPGFHGRKLGLKLTIVQADQKVPGFYMVVELDEDLFYYSGRRRADAQFPAFWLNAPRRRRRPGGLACHGRFRMRRRRPKGKQSGRAKHAHSKCQRTKDQHE
jgi:hypothetical protein